MLEQYLVAGSSSLCSLFLIRPFAPRQAVLFHREIMRDFAPYLTKSVVSIALLITALVPVESVELPVALRKSTPSFEDLRERKCVRRSTRISRFQMFCTRKNAGNFTRCKKKRFELAPFL